MIVLISNFISTLLNTLVIITRVVVLDLYLEVCSGITPLVLGIYRFGTLVYEETEV